MQHKYPVSMIVGLIILMLKYNLSENSNYIDNITIFQSALVVFLITIQYLILWIVCLDDRDPLEVEVYKNYSRDIDCSICLTVIDG